jgi:holliday junction DNA helicase RuvA
MIGHLEGKLIYKSTKHTLVETGGVGYKIFLSAEALIKLPAIGQPVKFWTHLSVKETALELFGFYEQKELEMFELLISISGVGPKSAQTILGLAGPDTLTRAIGAGDTSYLTKVSGIGKKTAEKIILELKDKLITLEDGASGLVEEAEAIEALQSLGYNLREAREALKRVSPQATNTEDKIKAALKHLSH